MSPLEKNRRRVSELLARFSQPRGLDLRLIEQHELLRVRMEVHLLVHPLWYRVAVVANPSCKTGRKQQKTLVLTNRMPVVNPEATS